MLRTHERRVWVAAVMVSILMLLPLLYVALPIRRPFLAEPAVWGLATLVGYWGFGSGVARLVAPARVDLGLRAAWGAAAFVVLCGPLLALGVLSKNVLFVLVAIGNASAATEVIGNRSQWALHIRGVGKLALRHPSTSAALLVVIIIAGFQYVGAVSELRGNPYDDDIAYLSLAKRLLDIGNIDEPFSFRRLSSFGGQTVLVGTALVRGSFANAHLFDRGQCFAILMALIAGHRRGARRVGGLALVMVALYLVTQEDLHINTASYFSGAMFFLALYRTQSIALEKILSVRAWLFPAVLLAAATATLRQNYLPVAALLLTLPYVFAWWGDRRSHLRGLGAPVRWLTLTTVDGTWAKLTASSALGFTIGLGGYAIATYRSNGTFLFPLALGTYNPAMSLKATVPSLVSELRQQVWVLVEGEPLRTLMILIPAALAFRDTRRGKPLLAFVAASFVGFVFLVHSFAQADPGNLSRYLFGFLAALALAVFLDVSVHDGRNATTTRGLHGSKLAQTMVWAALALQVAWRRPVEQPKHVAVFKSLAEAASYDVSAGNIWPVEADLYRRLQASVPAGEKLAVMLDEPYHLDFAKHRIANLDMPGYSSPAPGMPFFRGSEALGGYFRSLGYSYVAFVRPAFSRYQFRRDFWLDRLITDAEVWRICGAYMVDFIDNLTALASRNVVVFEERGMVVMKLSVPGDERAP